MLEFEWLWAIILLPLPWVIKKIRPYKNEDAPILRFPKIKHIQEIYKPKLGNIIKKPTLSQFLFVVFWILLVLSVMRPTLVRQYVLQESSGYDLMLAVDLSRSMESIDFSEYNKPISRISATKKVVSSFVSARQGDRIGLVVFADQAYLPIPLTLDIQTVNKMLHNLLVGMAGETTAIGDAIAVATQALYNRPEASRVLILLTDGQDTASHIQPLEAAKIAAESRVKIYTIGVGNSGLDEELLRKISEMTGGIYHKVTTTDALQKVYQQIDKLEKSDEKQGPALIKEPLFKLPLLVGLICLLLQMTIFYTREMYV